MAFLSVGPPQKEYSAKKTFEIFQLIETAVNNINEQNFRRKLNGGVIASRSMGMGALEWREHIIPLVMAAPSYQTAETTPQNVGGYFGWDPAKFPGGIWCLEADIAVSNAAATARCELTGSTTLKTVTTQATSLTRVRSDLIIMPAAPQNLWIKFSTNNGSHNAILGGAKLVFIPQ